MNDKRRKALKDAKMYMERVSNIISCVLDEEQDALDNMPENLQYSEKYERIEMAIDKLESALEQIDNAKEDIDEAGT